MDFDTLTFTDLFTDQQPAKTVITPDTCGGDDTISIFTLFSPVPGYQYILSFPKITGGGDDSVRYIVETIAYSSGNIDNGHKYVDSVKVKTGKYVYLPYNKKLIGKKYTTRIIGVTDNGGEQFFAGGTIDIDKVKF